MFPFGAFTTIVTAVLVRSVCPEIATLIPPASTSIVKPRSGVGATPPVTRLSNDDCETEVSAVVPSDISTCTDNVYINAELC